MEKELDVHMRRFVGVELPDYCTKTFGFSDKPEDNFHWSLSMGGFGAISYSFEIS